MPPMIKKELKEDRFYEIANKAIPNKAMLPRRAKSPNRAEVQRYSFKAISVNSGTGDSGSNTGLLAIVDNRHYLFNAPDGL